MDNFFLEYRVGVASPAQLEDVYKLRYATYCREMGWEEGDASTATEKDTWDDSGRAWTVVVEHRWRNELAACIRVVLGSPLPCASLMPLPDLRPPVAELGRSVTHPRYRGSPVSVVAFLGALVLAKELGAQTVVALTEKTYMRMMRFGGVQSAMVAGPVEHRGKRYLYASGADAVVSDKVKNSWLYKNTASSIKKSVDTAVAP